MTTTAADRRSSGTDEGGSSASGLIGAGRGFAWLLIICGFIGVGASAAITHDKLKLLEDPNYTPPCSLNPVFSCKSVMESWQSHVFGFSNPYIGWVAFSMLVVIGFSLLAGGAFRKWWWVGLWLGSLFGIGFVFFLQYSSLYDISRLCLWCMAAWAVTILVFWYTTVQNIRTGVFRVPEGVRSGVLEFHWVVPVLWYGVIALLIYLKWGNALFA
ncbi:vitamin K epoxide reductase family protein [Streptomyces sp. NPDC051940]|uniref:vitamin K epoxide reductase family protein n=1 Tax=Streptomyces sp. NPDC051940 TaxID=3155675 RepID=UPI0034261B94